MSDAHCQTVDEAVEVRSVGESEVIPDLARILVSAEQAYEDTFYKDVIDWLLPYYNNGSPQSTPDEPDSDVRIRALVLLTSALMKEDEPGQAIAILELAQKAAEASEKPMDARLLKNYANALVRAGRTDKAIGILGKYFESAEDNRRDIPLVAAYLNALLKEGFYARIDQWFKDEVNANWLDELRLTRSPDVIDMMIVHAESCMRARRFDELHTILSQIERFRLSADQLWRIRYLHTAALIDGLDSETSQPQPDLAGLKSLAVATGNPESLWKTILVESRSLMMRQQFPQARQTLSSLMRSGVPESIRSEALLRTSQTFLAQKEFSKALAWLGQFEKSEKSQPVIGWIWLTISQIHFEQYLDFKMRAMPAEARSALAQSRKKSEDVINLIPGSDLGGHARFQLGWCLAESGQWIPALEEFEAASSLFPPGKHQLDAMMKVCELNLETEQFEAALASFEPMDKLIRQMGYSDPELLSRLDLARVRTLLAIGKAGEAGEVVSKMISMNYRSEAAINAGILFSQHLASNSEENQARELLSSLLEQIKDPYVEGIIRENIIFTYSSQADWSNAYREADEWVVTFREHDHHPQVFLQLCYLSNQVKGPDAARHNFNLFLNQYPRHEKAPVVSFWLAQHYFDAGEYESATRFFSTLIDSKSWDRPDLKFESRLKLSQCNFKLGDIETARQQLRSLIAEIAALERKSPGVEPTLAVHGHATLVLADSYISGLSSDDPAEAIEILSEFIKSWPGHPMIHEVANYAGRLALRNLRQNPERLAQAEKFFSLTANAVSASASLVAEARFGLASLNEIKASLDSQKNGESRKFTEEATRIYRTIFYSDPQSVHSFWIKKAGLAAIRLMMQNGQSEGIQALQKRFVTLFPGDSDALQQIIQSFR